LKPEVALGLALRELRLARGLSQEKLALEAGIERNYISLLELGKNSASIDKLFKLSSALSIRASDLLLLVEAKLINQDNQAIKSKVA